ncbi:MAG TPA: NTP transferase domain-containing protein [Acetobacteraceae bacterium]|jgi:molybdopterin-guanine dinucleotide biosynthesis protein A|nr:NTP transferase domain-containing protein [Acetobacteraceae bacterium]
MTPCPAALVLAGGGARRLGGIDQPLLMLGGQTVLARILLTPAPQAGPIALSANSDPAWFAACGLPVLDDGALAGKRCWPGGSAGRRRRAARRR